MKRVKIFCLMVCISLFLTSCGKGGSAVNESDRTNQANQSSAAKDAPKREWVYVPEVIEVDAKQYVAYEKMQLAGDVFCYAVQGGDTETAQKNLCRYSLTTRELKKSPIDFPEGGRIWDLGKHFFTQAQELYATANVYPADYSSMKRFLCKFDTEGNCLFSKDITKQAGRNESLDRLTVDAQGRIYIFMDKEILLYTGDGEYHGSVRYCPPESTVPIRIKGACSGADGKYYVCIGKGHMLFNSTDLSGEILSAEEARWGEDRSVSSTLAEIDFENAKLTEVATDLPNVNGICAGKLQEGDSDSGYDFLFYDNRAVYGYNLASQKNNSGSAGEELFVWLDSDINGYCVTNLYLLSDGRPCATVYDYKYEDKAIVALTKVKGEDAPIREELVLATVDGKSDLEAMAVKFNRGNSRYHITVKRYESLTDLYNAVLKKDPIDLIDISGVNVQKLVSRGFLENLTPYVEQSEALKPADFVDGILDAYTFEDTLVGIPTSFSIRTVVGKETQMEQKAGLTLEELLTAADRYPKAKTFDGVTKEEMMQYIMMFNEDAFIDWKTGDCHFESEKFKAVLQYVNRFPDALKGEEEGTSLSDKIQRGEVLFNIADMSTFRAVQRYEKMFGGNVSCVGFPTVLGKGGHLLLGWDAYAIAVSSEHKEGAWQFIEDLLTRDKPEMYYETYEIGSFSHYFPSLKRVLNERVEDAIEEDRLIPKDKYPIYDYGDGRAFQPHALSWDEVNVILNLIPDATPAFSVKEDEVIKIIGEEAPAYYTGQKKEEDVMKVIQNRVSLYVRENL